MADPHSSRSPVRSPNTGADYEVGYEQARAAKLAAYRQQGIEFLAEAPDELWNVTADLADQGEMNTVRRSNRVHFSKIGETGTGYGRR